MQKLAYFCFEASPTIGAGHAIRSCVVADALAEEGWVCKLVTNEASYKFIAGLKRFERIEPEHFYNNPITCNLLVIDNYELDHVYEKHFRTYAKKILVIDDLANRNHDCDIVLDQTYGREATDYKNLVPQQCKILAGSDYVLLRKEFIELRPKALEKRRQTTEVKRILISMGGSDQQNYTLKALEMVKESGFKGAIDIVMGFTSINIEPVKNYVASLPNECVIHVNANMSKLMYEADLAIGAAGTSVWERCCLGLPQCLTQIADNQEFCLSRICSFVYKIDLEDNFASKIFNEAFATVSKNYKELSEKISRQVDAMGIQRAAQYIKEICFEL